MDIGKAGILWTMLGQLMLTGVMPWLAWPLLAVNVVLYAIGSHLEREDARLDAELLAEIAASRLATIGGAA